MHPAVFKAFDSWLENQKKAPYVLKEAALMFESDSYKFCDRIPSRVQAPLETRVMRVVKRDGLTPDDVKRRDAKQFSEEKKIQLADYFIKNDDTELVILTGEFEIASGRYVHWFISSVVHWWHGSPFLFL